MQIVSNKRRNKNEREEEKEEEKHLHRAHYMSSQLDPKM